MGNQRPFRTMIRSFGKFLILFILSSCSLFIGYFHILQAIDLSICMHQVAKIIDIDPNYPALRKYLQEKLIPGMTQQDVQATLEQIGPIQIFNDVSIRDDTVTDEVILKKCHHPSNRFRIYIRYTPEGVLNSIFIDDDS